MTVVARRATQEAGFWKVAATSFGVLFIAEFGDLTQIAIATWPRNITIRSPLGSAGCWACVRSAAWPCWVAGSCCAGFR